MNRDVEDLTIDEGWGQDEWVSYNDASFYDKKDKLWKPWNASKDVYGVLLTRVDALPIRLPLPVFCSAAAQHKITDILNEYSEVQLPSEARSLTQAKSEPVTTPELQMALTPILQELQKLTRLVKIKNGGKMSNCEEFEGLQKELQDVKVYNQELLHDIETGKGEFETYKTIRDMVGEDKVTRPISMTHVTSRVC